MGSESLRHARFWSFFDLTQVVYTLVTILLTRTVCIRFYKRRAWLSLAISLVMVWAFFIGFRYFLEQILAYYLIGKTNYFDTTWYLFIRDNIQYGLLCIIQGVLVYFAEDAFLQKEKNRALEQKQRDSELLYLQANINPHFLYNSLNNIYALLDTDTEKARKALIQLSRLTRATFERKEFLIALKNELLDVSQYIELQKLRYHFPLQITLQIEAPETTLVPPFLLTTLIENACKHGKLQDFPVTLQVYLEKDRIYLKSSNYVSNQTSTDQRHGVGLNNLKQRLDLLFPQQVGWEVFKTTDIFTINLSFPYRENKSSPTRR